MSESKPPLDEKDANTGGQGTQPSDDQPTDPSAATPQEGPLSVGEPASEQAVPAQTDADHPGKPADAEGVVTSGSTSVEAPALDIVETDPTAEAGVSEIDIDPSLAVSGPADATGETDGDAADGLDIGSQAIGTEDDGTPKPAPRVRGKIDRFGTAMGTGRRKTSVARVRISDGDGKFRVNGKSLDEYFAVERDRFDVLAPLKATGMTDQVNIWVRVEGGGTTGQAGAVVLGIARALQAKNEGLHESLADGGFLTRDDRMVERKKYGYKKARKSFQFSKR